MQPVVVYDTNVLISGMIWGGVPYRSIELAQQNKVKGVICDDILDEFEDNRTYASPCWRGLKPRQQRVIHRLS